MHPTDFNNNTQPIVVIPTKNIKLSFRDMPTLWAFVKDINVTNTEINRVGITLLSECSEKEINLALTKYSAAIIEGQLTNTSSKKQAVPDKDKEQSL
jgi:hypothetical protein